MSEDRKKRQFKNIDYNIINDLYINVVINKVSYKQYRYIKNNFNIGRLREIDFNINNQLLKEYINENENNIIIFNS